MFSLRFLAAFTVLAAVAALPAPENPSFPLAIVADDGIEDEPWPWMKFPIANFFAPFWNLFKSFPDIGPKIVSDDKNMVITTPVKDYKKDEIKVKVKGDTFIIVQGIHEASKDSHDLFTSQFFHTYTLPANSSGADVTAELTSDSYLIITAPLNGSSKGTATETDREVPIVETNKPYVNEEKTTSAAPPTTTQAEDERKEPTTPPAVAGSDQPTEKDNSIPHGNEVFN